MTSPRTLLALATPIAAMMLVDIAMPIVDGIICGRVGNNANALEALGLCTQLWILLCVPAIALSTGTGALAARAHGAKHAARVHWVLRQSTVLALAVGSVVGILCAVLGRQMLVLLGASPPVADIGATFLRVLALAHPIAYVISTVSSVLLGTGRPRLLLACSVASNVLNAVLAYGLVFGKLGLPALGLTGAAVAAVIATATNLGLMIVGMRVARTETEARGPSESEDSIVRSIVRIAGPALVTTLAYVGTMTSFYWILGQLDESAVTAHAIGARFAALLLVPTFALSEATSILVGNALGAGSIDRARAALRAALVTVAIVMVPIAVLNYVGAPFILEAYDISPQSSIWPYGLQWLHVISFSLVLQGLFNAYQGLLLGAGASAAVMRITLGIDVGFRLVVVAVLVKCTNLGPLGVWLSWPIAMLVELPVVHVVYRRGRWGTTGVEL